MTNQSVLHIHHRDELDRILSGRRARRVALAIDSIASEERHRWEARINRYYRACGCGSGAFALVAVLVAGGALAYRYTDWLMASPYWAAGVAPVALLASLGIGKMVGLRLARWQLASTVSSLRSRLELLEHPRHTTVTSP